MILLRPRFDPSKLPKNLTKDFHTLLSKRKLRLDIFVDLKTFHCFMKQIWPTFDPSKLPKNLTKFGYRQCKHRKCDVISLQTFGKTTLTSHEFDLEREGSVLAFWNGSSITMSWFCTEFMSANHSKEQQLRIKKIQLVLKHPVCWIRLANMI